VHPTERRIEGGRGSAERLIAPLFFGADKHQTRFFGLAFVSAEIGHR
jgi:hypothetical protein